MNRLNVLMVSTSSSFANSIEAVLQQTGYLDQFRWVDFDNLPQTFAGVPTVDLVCVHYRPDRLAEILSFGSAASQTGSPPIFFFIDAYDPQTALFLINQGGRRVLPVDGCEHLLPASLEAVFGRVDMPAIDRHLAPDLLPNGLRGLIASVPVGIAILRASDALCLDCNASLAHLLAIPREELLGCPLSVLDITAEIARLLDPAAESAQAAGLEVERKLYLPDRTVKDVLVSISRLDWESQTHVMVMVHDITAHQRANEDIQRLNDELERLILTRTGALEAANRELAAEVSRRKAVEEISNQLEQILWQTPDVVAICNPNGSMRYLNQAGRTLFRISDRQPISEADVFRAYSPFFQRKFREEILPHVLQHSIWRGEVQLQLPDGKSIPVSQVVLVNQDRNQEQPYFALIARDISEIKRVEQELRDSREEYRTLAEAAHDYIFLVNINGSIEYANRFACQALNLNVERVAGMSMAHFFPANYSTEMLQMIAEVREIDSAVYTEGSFRLADREYWLGTWLVPVHNSTGKLVSILGISRDITEQHKTDEALKRALENEKQINQMQASFFAMTSHQFRTPLSSILLSVELLKKYGTQWDEMKRHEYLDHIDQSAGLLSAMLENILMISRVESGNYLIQQKTFDLIEFCTRIFQELATNDRAEHPVEFLHSNDPLMVCSDAHLLRHILDNLIRNAFKYSPPGSTVRINLNREASLIVIEISDEGIGIPEKDQQRLFQPFQRASNTDAYPGTGIGLTIVKKSVELLQGDVSVKSKEGQGTTFILRFPDGRMDY